jgi:predicted dehydrogenase
MRHGDSVSQSFRAEWRYFLDAIRTGLPVEVTLEEARQALQVVLATLQSAELGRAVRVDEAPEEITPVGL